jgi:hypothetical protein
MIQHFIVVVIKILFFNKRIVLVILDWSKLIHFKKVIIFIKISKLLVVHICIKNCTHKMYKLVN